MNDDVDVITETLISRPLSRTDEVALAQIEQFVSRRDFVSRRRSRVAFEILCGGVAAALVVTLVIALTRHSPLTPSPAHHTPAPIPTATITVSPTTPSPSVTLGPAIPLRIAQQVSLGGRQANAMFVSPSTVWVATISETYGQPGTLLRIDASTGRQTAAWMVGGDPVAVSAAGDYVWVANSYGDGSKVLPDQGTVMQFNATTGRLAHVYPAVDPAALVADGSGALAVSAVTANGPSGIYRLTAGRSFLLATVPGFLQGPSVSAQSALAVCDGVIYLGVSELTAAGAPSVNVYALSLGGGRVRYLATIQGEWSPMVTCDSSAIYVFDAAGDAPVRVEVADGHTSTLSEGGGPTAVVFASGLIWEYHIAGSLAAPQALSYLTAVNPSTGIESSSRLLVPGTDASSPFLLVQGSPGLWLVGGNETLLFHVTTG
jgi:hypothetical protein